MDVLRTYLMADKMCSEKGKEDYKKRKEAVEWLFGNINHNLVCTAHNLKVMWSKLGKTVAALCNIEGLVANFASKVTSFCGFIPIYS